MVNTEIMAAFLLEVLDSEEYKYMNYMIRNAQNVVDACYYWLKYYEIPYDPYCDDYYTLAFERADSANTIRRSCDPAQSAPWIKASMVFPRVFPTRLSHEAFPQGCPTCTRGGSRSSYVFSSPDMFH